MAPGDASGGDNSSKKSKKRRREGEHGGGTSGGGGERRSSSKKGVVLRCAAADSVNPLVVSFANQTVPKDMDAIKFRVHEGEDEGREGQKVVMGDGGRYVRCDVRVRLCVRYRDRVQSPVSSQRVWKSVQVVAPPSCFYVCISLNPARRNAVLHTCASILHSWTRIACVVGKSGHQHGVAYRRKCPAAPRTRPPGVDGSRCAKARREGVAHQQLHSCNCL